MALTKTQKKVLRQALDEIGLDIFDDSNNFHIDYIVAYVNDYFWENGLEQNYTANQAKCMMQNRRYRQKKRLAEFDISDFCVDFNVDCLPSMALDSLPQAIRDDLLDQPVL